MPRFEPRHYSATACRSEVASPRRFPEICDVRRGLMPCCAEHRRHSLRYSFPRAGHFEPVRLPVLRHPINKHPIKPGDLLCTDTPRVPNATQKAEAKMETRTVRTSSSRVVSRTKFCTTCCVALAPTRPPRPGPCTGISGLRLFRGSCLSLSLFRLLGRPDVNSPSRVTPGIMIAGAAAASDMSSIVGRLAGPLLSNNLAPLRDVCGEYNTDNAPVVSPTTICTVG